MNRVTQEQVREFLLARYARAIKELGLDPATITDDFDFLLREVIDSFGILEMIMSIEDEFQIQLDMASAGCRTNHNTGSALALRR